MISLNIVAVVIVSVILNLLFVNGAGRELQQSSFVGFGDLLSGSQNPFEQYSEGNQGSVDSGAGANTGNLFAVGTISNLNPSEQFGAGVGQFSQENVASVTQGLGDANSGNQIVTNDITDSSVITEQFSQVNIAESDLGNANSGNTLDTQDVTGSELDLTATSQYNTAVSNEGFANAGNIGRLGDIYGSTVVSDQFSVGNNAQSDSGPANAGNVLNLGNLSGRKLQKFTY